MKTPYPYQLDAIGLGVMRSALIADECGLGKTLVGIEIAMRRVAERGGPSLFIVPKSTLPQWTAAILEQTGYPPFRIEGHTPIVPQGNWMYLTHYEVLLSLGDHLSRFIWNTIVVDEVHRIKNRHALRTKALKRLRASCRIGLSGTPMEKSPADLWSILNWLHPGYFNSYWKFCVNYVQFENVYRGKEIYKKIVGGRNLEDLAQQLRFFMIKRTKDEVAPELPEKIIQHIPIQMSAMQREMYNNIAKSVDIEVPVAVVSDYFEDLVVKNELAKITFLQMVSSYPTLILNRGLWVDSGKVSWLDDYVHDNPEEVMVVFTRFRRTAEMIYKRYDSEGTALLMGRTAIDVVEFLEGRKRILVGTIAAMGEGLNLQRARTAIFLEADWSATKMSQAVDRIHRIGIDGPRNIIHLIASPIDQLIVDTFEHKWTEAELIQEFVRRQYGKSWHS